MSSSLVIIGGGATGTGIARAAAEAGHKVTLVEQGDMASGTTGHFHGMLHSGARYAVNDREVAAACYQENQRLRTYVPEVIRDTGGLFVAMTNEETAHADVLVEACAAAGIPIEEITVEQAREHEPNLSEDIKRAFTVPDGTIDGVALVALNRKAAESASVPATFITYNRVTGFVRDNGKISAVGLQHVETGETQEVACDFVINATGVWAGSITSLAGITLEMVYDKGTMVVLEKQLTNAVLNRCRPEADGDLLVPIGGQSIMGTTARVIDTPDGSTPTQEEIDVLTNEGAAMVPELASTGAVRVYAGVRPLLKPNQDDLVPGQSSRTISRGFQLVDHAEDGVPNLITITGGKVTLYRLMTEATLGVLRAKQL